MVIILGSRLSYTDRTIVPGEGFQVMSYIYMYDTKLFQSDHGGNEGLRAAKINIDILVLQF